MPSSLKTLAIFLIPVVCWSWAVAGEYSSDFQYYLADHQNEEMIGAIITMVDQVDFDALRANLPDRLVDRREWHEIVVRALQEKASATQADILAELAKLKAQGLVEKYQGLWIGNVVLVRATREALDILVRRDDVLRVEPDYPIENIEPIRKGGPEHTIESVESGLRAIRADEVWAMGYTGEGRLVSHLDTGVDGNHPALNARWRGYDPQYSGHPGWAWFDPLYNTQFPVDSWGHGTHTMGTLCGLGQSTGDTIGVAFGADWIAAGHFFDQSIPGFVSDALVSFQWIADPDGDPSTVWDVPDVCSNSWGLTPGMGYPRCDQTFWVTIDGVEAAGVVVVFAAGNEGPSSNTLRNPAARATTPTNVLSVGAIDGHNPYFPIADFSSRGPSYCTPNGQPTFKPELVAPGVEVRSSVPGGGYESWGWSGTSMACPHVAGVVALMRQANPNLTSEEIKQILLDTATDLGPTGEDNSYGMGIVDAFEAVNAALQSSPDPGVPDTLVVGNLDGSPLEGFPGQIINVPVWVKNDENVASMHLPVATENQFIVNRLGGSVFSTLLQWDFTQFLAPDDNQPSPGYTSQSLLAIADLDGQPNPFLNTQGAYVKIAEFTMRISASNANIGQTAAIIQGFNPINGSTIFGDEAGIGEWQPVFIPGTLLIVAPPPDPGERDTLIVGNLDLSPMHVAPGQTVNIPVWVRNDENVAALHIPVGTDNQYVVARLGGNLYAPLTQWDFALFLTPDQDQPTPGYTSQSLLAISDLGGGPNPYLNTGGTFVRIADFTVQISPDTSLIGQTTALVPGHNPINGDLIFGDDSGTQEWQPEFLGGTLEIVQGGCVYLPGDVNGNGDVNVVDVTYLVNYLSGAGSPPPDSCDCPPHGTFYPAADPNGDCEVNVLDVTYLVNFFAGTGPDLTYCNDCPPGL